VALIGEAAVGVWHSHASVASCGPSTIHAANLIPYLTSLREGGKPTQVGMVGFTDTRTGRAARYLALVGVLLALVAATHVHSSGLAPSETCAPCAFAHASAAIAPSALSHAVVLTAGWVVSEPRALVPHSDLPNPVGRAPPGSTGAFSI